MLLQGAVPQPCDWLRAWQRCKNPTSWGQRREQSQSIPPPNSGAALSDARPPRQWSVAWAKCCGARSAGGCSKAPAYSSRSATRQAERYCGPSVLPFEMRRHLGGCGSTLLSCGGGAWHRGLHAGGSREGDRALRGRLRGASGGRHHRSVSMHVHALGGRPTRTLPEMCCWRCVACAWTGSCGRLRR